MTAPTAVPTGAHSDLLMTADVAVAGWRSLRGPEQRWAWFQKLYDQAAHLDRRYRLALRSGWWEDEIQVELLATLGAWVGMFDYGGPIPKPKPASSSSCSPSASSYAAARSNSIPNATARRSSTFVPSVSSRHQTMFRENWKHDLDREFSLPPALDETIRVGVCTSGSPDEIAGRVQRAIGEYSGAAMNYTCRTPSHSTHEPATCSTQRSSSSDQVARTDPAAPRCSANRDRLTTASARTHTARPTRRRLGIGPDGPSALRR
jgi:hypothetical protein